MFKTSNRIYYKNLKRYDRMGFSSQVDYWMYDGTIFADLDSGDFCEIRVKPTNASGVDI